MSKPDDVLDDLFAGIGDTPTTGTTSSTNPQTTSSTTTSKSEKDILAEFDLLTADRPTNSRPTTPRGTIRKSLESRRPNLASSDLPTRRSGEGYGINTNLNRKDESGDVNAKLQTPVDSIAPTLAVTPPPSNTPGRNTATPATTTTSQQTSGGGGGGGGGGWWGSIFSTASSAITTAQHAVNTAQDRLSEIQKSEEAKKWTSQATSLLGTAQSELRSRALPTLSNFLQTIAPPIASHEQLRIHITHDIQNYPSIDTIVYGVFDRVMQQVEGGDLLVVQRGGEAKPRSSLGGGWANGPWYKSLEPRALNALVSSGVEEGVKLAKAAAEGYALEYTSIHGDTKNEAINPSNPTRKSDIFLSIQPITHPSPSYLTTATSTDDGDEAENLITFALYLHDPNHNISYSTLSQSIPAKWLEWIDAPAYTLHEDIAGIIEEGGVDPREWVVEWVEETLGLAVGVVAQRYVAKRMNVGGSSGVPGAGAGLDVKGKGREVGGGEEARALGM